MRRIPIWGFVLLVFGLSTLPQGQLLAAGARTVSIKETKSVPVIRRDFPIPTDPGLLIYLQRSSNSNTVVYTANFRADGTLDPKNPVNLFWRRFNNSGQKKDLGFFETRVAFGIRSRKSKTPDTYEIEFRALPGRKMILRQTGPNQTEMFGYIGEHKVRPVYIYVELDQSGFVPKVTALYLHGIDLASGNAITETLSISGGEIRD